MEEISINIGKRKIPLRFKMNQFIEIEEEIGNMMDIRDMILKGKNRLRNLVSVIRILGNAGLKHEGKEPDLTNEWLGENLNPRLLAAYQVAVIACLAKEGESEAVAEENENKERDLVLEEINEKKDHVNSHTGG